MHLHVDKLLLAFHRKQKTSIYWLETIQLQFSIDDNLFPNSQFTGEPKKNLFRNVITFYQGSY